MVVKIAPKELRALDLNAELQTVAGGKVLVAYRAQVSSPEYTGPVETLVIDGERAGQVVNADAQWGDWDEATQTIRLDSGPVVGLDGSAVDGRQAQG